MTTHEPPPIGAFLRPVGKGYAYCLRVVRTFPPTQEDPREGAEFERWGMKNQTPVKDGHQDHCWLTGITRVLPGVWKDEWPHNTPRWTCCPIYYRLMNTGPKGQMELI